MTDSVAPRPPPLPRTRSRAWSVAMGIGLQVLIITAAAWLILRPPALEQLMPRCVIYQRTGLLCPGCGGTRATEALLHGHIAQALRYNPFTTLVLPILLVIGFHTSYRLIFNRPVTNWTTRLPALLVFGIAIFLILFMILRNIPHPALDILRPPISDGAAG